MMMKLVFLTTFAILAGLAHCDDPEVPGTLIDYSQCNYIYGNAGDWLRCQNGYVGIGACGSQTSRNCNAYIAQIECCKMAQGEMQTSCEDYVGVNGESMTCPGTLAVYGICGTAGTGQCEGRTTGIECCESELPVSGSDCYWDYFCNGQYGRCRDNYVMQGRCGSLNFAECPANDDYGSTTHGIRCCPLNRLV